MNYYIAQAGGQKKGPFKKKELLAHELTSDMLVWRQGMSNWAKAGSLLELADLFAQRNVITLTSASSPLSNLQQEIEKSKREVEELRKRINKLDTDNLESLIQPPLKLKEKNPYDFRCPTWIKEAWMVLACVAGHFFLGITGITSFFYIFLDLIGFALCITAFVIGSKINSLNKISYAQGTPSREKADKLARINGWLVSITALVGMIIVFIHSGLDMALEGWETGITYAVIYISLMGLLWFCYFRPIKLDNYSMRTSPTLSTNERYKKLNEIDEERWRKELRRHGLRPGSNDETDDHDGDWDSDSDSYDDFDWDSDDDDDGDWDWGGGSSSGGGASSEW